MAAAIAATESVLLAASPDSWKTCSCLVLRHRRHVQVAVSFAHSAHAMEVLHFPDERRYLIRVINKEGVYCHQCVGLNHGRYQRAFEMTCWRSVSMPSVQRCVDSLPDPRTGLVSYLLEHPITTLQHLLRIIRMRVSRNWLIDTGKAPIPENLVWKTLMQLLQALAWAARAKVTFGGLTAENALIFADGSVKISNGLYYLNMPVPTAQLELRNDALPDGTDQKLDCYNPIAWTWTVGGIGWQMVSLQQTMPNRKVMDDICRSDILLLPNEYTLLLEKFVRNCMEFGRFYYDLEKREVDHKNPIGDWYPEVVKAPKKLQTLHRAAERNYHNHQAAARMVHANLLEFVEFLSGI